jgi:hypothetical protein
MKDIKIKEINSVTFVGVANFGYPQYRENVPVEVTLRFEQTYDEEGCGDGDFVAKLDCVTEIESKNE